MNNIYQAKGTTLEEQYFDAGTLFGQSIRKSVAALSRKRSKASQIRRRVAEKTLANLKGNKIAQEFVTCISAWARGAAVTAEQAMWLMADNLSGCQTMIVRYASGVALLHTEEEFIDGNHIELHMSSPHTMQFLADGTLSTTLVYNDLLPGAGLYSWTKDLIVAVDSLFLREDGIDLVERPLLANVVSWMIWRMTPEQVTPESILKLVKQLGVLVDGYTFNVVRKIDSKIEGFKITFARDESHSEELGLQVGDYLRQVNIIDPAYPPMTWAVHPRNIWRGGWKYFNDRLKTIDSHARKYKHFTQMPLVAEETERVHKRILQTLFSDLRSDFINPDVGAICIGFVDATSTSVSCKLNDESSPETVEYVDYA